MGLRHWITILRLKLCLWRLERQASRTGARLTVWIKEFENTNRIRFAILYTEGSPSSSEDEMREQGFYCWRVIREGGAHG